MRRESGVAGPRIAAVVYLVAVLLITWLPEEQAGQVTGLVAVVAQWFSPIIPFGIGYVALEFLANVALFVPIGMLMVWGWPSVTWWQATAVGFAVSALIEVVQLWLPTRVATVSDVLANTLGTALGAVLVVNVRRRVRRQRSSLGA